MIKSGIITLAIWALLSSTPALAWQSIFLQPDNVRRESAWRIALADHLDADEEVSIEGGRVDVMTEDLAIEVDWPHKWHEGLGQALHYADATERTGTLALISYSKNPEAMRQSTRDRMKLVERQCEKNGIKLIVLYNGTEEEAKKPAVETPQTALLAQYNIWKHPLAGLPVFREYQSGTTR